MKQITEILNALENDLADIRAIRDTHVQIQQILMRYQAKYQQKTDVRSETAQSTNSNEKEE